MADKKKNPIVDMLSHIAMGIGGGLTGQDYLGTFYKWKEAEAEKEKTDWEEEYYKRSALGADYQSPLQGTVPSAVTPPTDLAPMGREVSTIAEGAPRAFTDFQKRPQLKPEHGSVAGKFAGYDPIEMKEFEKELSVGGQVAAQEMKESEKKQRDLRRVSLKLDQSADILARAYQTTTSMLAKAGIPFKPERGIGGRLFGVAQKVMSATGYNEFVKTYKGNLNESAIALMRMAMPGRSERMVNLYKQTLPDLTGNPFEDVAQIAESMTAAYGDSLATLKDSKGKPKYTVTEARQLRNSFKESSYNDLKGVFIKAGVITQEQANTLRATSDLGKGTLKTKSGNTYRFIGE